MCTPFFSIVIPVYNVEKYLNECVDSVLIQTFTDFEVILVDDGSPDKCPVICDEYAEKDSRIQVVHKTNGGLSDARNHGVLAAHGKYLMFLDSDDYWADTNALQHIYNALIKNNCAVDLVIFQATSFYPNGKMIPDNWNYPENFNSLCSEDALCYMVEKGILPGSAWVTAIKRQFLLDNELFFKVGIKSEDIEWLIRVHNNLPQYLYVDSSFYMYRKGRVGSITNSWDKNYLHQVVEMMKSYTNFCFCSQITEHCLKSYLAYQYVIIMAKMVYLPRAERDILIDEISRSQNILSFDLHPKVKQANKMIRFVGFRATCFLLGIYIKIRNKR